MLGSKRIGCLALLMVMLAVLGNPLARANPDVMAFVDGSSTAIGTGEITIASVSTSFASGSNFVIAIVQLESTGGVLILHNQIRLTRGGTTLMSNNYDFKMASSASDNQKWYALMGIDTNPGSNPTYDVRAMANATGVVSGEAKILVINGVTGSEAQSANNVTISTGETTMATLSTAPSGGDNIVLAIFEVVNVHDKNQFELQNARLKRESSILASNQYDMYVGSRDASNNLQVHLIPFLDGDVPPNPTPTYTATGTSNSGNVKGRAKIVAFSRGWWYASYIDGESTAISNTVETILAQLSTNFLSGSEAVEIASEQFDGSTSANSISSGSNKLQQNNDTVSQKTNEYALQFPQDGTADDRKSFGLLNRFTSTPSSPQYEVKATASATGMNGETKILAIAFNAITPAPEFPYGVLVPLATGFAIFAARRRLLKRWDRVFLAPRKMTGQYMPPNPFL